MELRFPSSVPHALLRVVALLLLAQGVAAWAILVGVAGPVAGFDALTFSARNLLVTQAIICPVAMAGTWFAAQWGPVLWFCVIVVLAMALVLGAPLSGVITWLVVVHTVAFALWLATALRPRRTPEAKVDTFN